DARRHGLEDHLVVRDKVADIEDYWQAADLGLFTSETESFCLSILEGMFFGCPSVSTRVGGIAEVVDNGETGLLVPLGDANLLARAGGQMISATDRRRAMGQAGELRACKRFSAGVIVPRYEALYHRQIQA